MTLPNFLIIGQMKAGTSSLHAYLRQHPQVFMPALKETRFFCERVDDPTRPTWNQRGLPATLAEYEQLFAQVTDETIAIGEASPQYLQNNNAPHQIKRCLGDVKLIVSLRRPSDRIYSSYLMERRIRREHRDFATAFHTDFVQRGMRESTYDQLKTYFDLFGRALIKVIRLDDLVRDANSTMGALFSFLGVHEFQPNISARHNEGGVWRSESIGRLSTSIRANRVLSARMKRSMPKPVWRYLKRLHHANLAPARPIDEEVRCEIDSFFWEDTKRVQQLVDLDLSHWAPDFDRR